MKYNQLKEKMLQTQHEERRRKWKTHGEKVTRLHRSQQIQACRSLQANHQKRKRFVSLLEPAENNIQKCWSVLN